MVRVSRTSPPVGRWRSPGGSSRRCTPSAPVAAVVEDRLAVHHRLDLARDAPDGAQQDVLGLVVVGCPAVRRRAVDRVVPRSDQQHVADDDPSRRGAPAGLEDHRAGQVAPARRDVDVERRDPEGPGKTPEDRPEDGRRVEARHAHPRHRAIGREQCGDLTVAEEAVVADRHRAKLAGDVVACLALLRHEGRMSPPWGARKGRVSRAGRAGRAVARQAEGAQRAAEVADLDHGHPVDGALSRRLAAVADRHDGHPEAEPRGLGDPLREVADLAHLSGQADLAERDHAVRAARTRWPPTPARSRWRGRWPARPAGRRRPWRRRRRGRAARC